MWRVFESNWIGGEETHFTNLNFHQNPLYQMDIAIKSSRFLPLNKIPSTPAFSSRPCKISVSQSKRFAPMAALAASPAVGLSETFNKLREQGKVNVSFYCLQCINNFIFFFFFLHSAFSVWNLYMVCLFVWIFNCFHWIILFLHFVFCWLVLKGQVMCMYVWEWFWNCWNHLCRFKITSKYVFNHWKLV